MYFRIWRRPDGDLVPVVVGHKHLEGQDLPPTDGKPYFEFPPDYGLWKHEHKQQYLLNLLNAMTCRCMIRMETVRRKFSTSYSGNPFAAFVQNDGPVPTINSGDRPPANGPGKIHHGIRGGRHDEGIRLGLPDWR